MDKFMSKYARREWAIVKDELILDLDHLVAVKKQKDGTFHNIRFLFGNGEEYVIRRQTDNAVWENLKKDIRERRL